MTVALRLRTRLSVARGGGTYPNPNAGQAGTGGSPLSHPFKIQSKTLSKKKKIKPATYVVQCSPDHANLLHTASSGL